MRTEMQKTQDAWWLGRSALIIQLLHEVEVMRADGSSSDYVLEEIIKTLRETLDSGS